MASFQARIIRHVWCHYQLRFALIVSLLLSLAWLLAPILILVIIFSSVQLIRQSKVWCLPVLMLFVLLWHSSPSDQNGSYCSVDFSQASAFGYSTVFDNGANRLLVQSDKPVKLGWCLVGEVEVRPPATRLAPGSFNPITYYQSQGIIGRASIGEQLVDSNHWLATLRSNLDLRLQNTRHHPYWRALLLGSRSGLSDAQKAALQESQAYHLLVVSGLHITIILLFVYYIFIPLPYILRLVILAAVAAGLPFLLGGGVSVWRASVMSLVATWLIVQRRTQQPFDKLLIAGVVLVMINPTVWFSSGAWLSFAAVFVLSQLPSHWGLWRIQLALLVMLMPVSWMMGLALNPVGSLANLIWVPALTVLLPSAYILLLFNKVHWLDPALSAFITALDWLPPAFWLPVPMAHFSALVLIAVWIWLLNVPGRVVLSMAMLLLAYFARPLATQEVLALDVGQGTALLIVDPPRVWVIDTGPGNPSLTGSSGQAIVQQIASRRGIKQVQMLISHDDLDHKGGSVTLLRAYPKAHIALGQFVPGLLGLECDGWQWSQAIEDNDASCVVQYSLATSQILITGDLSRIGEYAWLAEFPNRSVDLLIAGHHGSSTSTANALLDAIEPKCVWFTAGNGNPFGHPSDQVIAKLRDRSIDFAITSEQGVLKWRNNQLNCKE
ncbi:ComEC/Rec2 family competence protein [Salinibius halmophilus]|uniref:ComEC/Rec2 family competence protein n=1 Tax=Salinibius halmophilus TaxID=1853216 RepID=UPI000E6624EA|nr:ComEC/Rec2 family competence protein [Salinibius halmophilus]